MDGAEILQLYQLSYSDLVRSSRPHDPHMCPSISRSVMEALGPNGPGLLCITGAPSVAVLRRQLLPLARKLALLDPDTRRRILKEHHLGTDVPLKNPDRDVSSFAMQLKYSQCCESAQDKICPDTISYPNLRLANSAAVTNPGLQENEFKNLGGAFKELGLCMIELGLCIARVCDGQIGGQVLENSLLESCAAKGRLIHYHSDADKRILRESESRKLSTKQISNRKGDGRNAQQEDENSNKEIRGHGTHLKLWQQWHYDYGIFTILTDPMFLSTSLLSPDAADQCTSMRDHTYLQIYHPGENKVYMVKTPQNSVIVEVGECADILSKGRLRSTLHCVCRPDKLDHMSRETFAVFLQPPWTKSFCVSDSLMEHLKLEDSQGKEQRNGSDYSLDR